MHGKKILVTGVAGFIGSNLADRLVAAGYDVVGIDDLSAGLMEQVNPKVEFHKLDIRSKDIYPVFEGVDTVFHLAAKNQLQDCQRDPVATIEINVGGTTNVFEASVRAKVRKVVYAQSSAVEEGEARIKGFYAVSKVIDALIADSYQAGFGLTTVGARYFNVYGPRQDYRRKPFPPVMSAFVLDILKNRKPTIYEGSENNKRDFVYVDDVNDFHLLCIDDDRVNNRMFRIASGQTYSIIDVLNGIKKAMGSDIEPVVKPRMADDIPTNPTADTADTLALGWKPKTSFDEGLKALVEFLKGENAKGKIQ